MFINKSETSKSDSITKAFVCITNQVSVKDWIRSRSRKNLVKHPKKNQTKEKKVKHILPVQKKVWTLVYLDWKDRNLQTPM